MTNAKFAFARNIRENIGNDVALAKMPIFKVDKHILEDPFLRYV